MSTLQDLKNAVSEMTEREGATNVGLTELEVTNISL